MQSQSLLLGWDESESFLPGNVARPSSEGTHTRTHARARTLTPRIPSGRFVCRGLFLSLPRLVPPVLRFPFHVLDIWRATKVTRERGRQEGHGKGRETVGLCFAKTACCSQGTYRYAFYKSQLRKVTCRRSLGDAVLCLNNASRLLHLSKWQFAVTRCVLEVGSNLERE